MLDYAVAISVIAFIAAVLGFRGLADLSAEMVGWFFAVLFTVFLAVELLGGRGLTAIP